MTARFLLHPSARLFDGRGAVETSPLPCAHGVIDDRSSARALQLALGRDGAAFRIGGAAEGPVGEGVFETLTSGSSGTPRRIRRHVDSWLKTFAINAGLFGIGPGFSVAVLGRLVHSLSLYGALEALHLGADLHLLDGQRPDRQRGALVARRIALIYATPAQIRLLMGVDGPQFTDLRFVLIGGSKLDAALRAALTAAAPMARICEFYGAAETSFITLSDTKSPPDSVGSPYSGVEISVRDTEGANLPEGGQGEIWIRSPYIFLGYAGQDQGAARWLGGWISVGEIGFLRDGALYLCGRAGRMVKVADQNVFPEEIEAFLETLPGIKRAAVVARPDGLRGYRLIAVCQGDTSQTAAVLRAARLRLGPLKSPHAIVWKESWPELASGKTDLGHIMAEVALWAR